MGWFGGKDDKNETLKKRDWNSSGASEITARPMHAYGTREVHQRIDGTYIVEKDRFGNVVSAKRA